MSDQKLRDLLIKYNTGDYMTNRELLDLDVILDDLKEYWKGTSDPVLMMARQTAYVTISRIEDILKARSERHK